MNAVASPPLAEVLHYAAEAWQHFRAGRSLDRALAAALADRPDLRPAVQDATYKAVRHLAASERLVELLAARPPAAEVAALLAVALAQLQTDNYAEYAVVDQAVSSARNSLPTRGAAGFVNALLRNFLRQRATLLSELQLNDTVRYNLPHWWIERLQRAYPTDWTSVAEHQRQPPPLVLRVNVSRLPTERYLANLNAAGMDATRVGEQAVWLHDARPVAAIPGFSEGEVSVQDAGAQLAAVWLDARAGMQVLDACAAPGGKTAHLAELGATVTALEIDAIRAMRIEENLRRGGLTAHLITGDALRPESWQSQIEDLAKTETGAALFDRILVDAPCTASGIVRRHPDIPWLRRSADVAQLTKVQRELLHALWPLLKVGGRLLYAVCSLFPEEGREQVDRFVGRHCEARLVPLPAAQLLPTAARAPAWQSGLPTLHDGFFYALLEKTG